MNIGKCVCSSLMGPCYLHAAVWLKVLLNYKLYSFYNTKDYIAWDKLPE